MEKLMMLSLSVLAFGLFLGSVAQGQKTYNEQCEEEKTVTTNTSSGISVSHFHDNCDKKVYLICKESRCRCSDAVFGVYTSKDVKLVSRSKRSPSPGKGKGSSSKGKVSTGKAVAVGAGAAVVAGGAGYVIGQHAANSGGNGGGSWSSGSSNSGSSRSRDKYITVHSCYQRVGGDCAIDANKVTEVTNTTIVNGTTTTTKTTINYKERPECIQGAECVAKRSPGEDTNVGECACVAGYDKTKTDLCMKQKKSGAGITTSSLGLILGALIIKLI